MQRIYSRFWTLFGRYWYKNLLKVTILYHKSNLKKASNNAVCSNMEENTKSLEINSSPRWSTTFER